MSRKLYFRFVESGVQGLVQLYEENAPETCNTLWNARKPVPGRVYRNTTGKGSTPVPVRSCRAGPGSVFSSLFP